VIVFVQSEIVIVHAVKFSSQFKVYDTHASGLYIIQLPALTIVFIANHPIRDTATAHARIRVFFILFSQ
jgi:hypothetical protein